MLINLVTLLRWRGEGGLFSMSARSDVGPREWLIVQCRLVKDEVVFDWEVFLDDVRGGQEVGDSN